MNGILCKHLLWKSHFTTILSLNRVANETLSVIKNSCNKNFDDAIDLQGKKYCFAGYSHWLYKVQRCRAGNFEVVIRH